LTGLCQLFEYDNFWFGKVQIALKNSDVPEIHHLIGEASVMFEDERRGFCHIKSIKIVQDAEVEYAAFEFTGLSRLKSPEEYNANKHG
jgi:hypothetical protein